MGNKTYRVINRTLTDKYGDSKLHTATAASTIITGFLIVANATRKIPALRVISNIGVGITSVIGACDIIIRTDNYVHDNVVNDPDKGEGVLDYYKDVVFNTSSKVEKSIINTFEK